MAAVTPARSFLLFLPLSTSSAPTYCGVSGYVLQWNMVSGPCSYSCTTGKRSVSLPHPGLRMDKFPAMNARPQMQLFFLMPCFISAAGEQSKLQTSFQPNTLSSPPLPLIHRAYFRHPALPHLPPPPRTNFDVKEPVKDARAPSGSIFTKRQWVTVEPYLMQLHSMLEWGDPKKSLLCHHKISAEPGKEAELRLKYAVMQGSPASHTSFSCTQ